MAAAPTPSRPYGARLLRVVADAVVITVAYLIGISIDYAIRSFREPMYADLLATMGNYLPALLPLLAIALTYFTVGGFYSRQRTYRGLHKAQAIIQACLLTFLTYGALAYALRAYLQFPPAIAIVATAVIATVLLLGMHLYAVLWTRLGRSVLTAADPDSSASTRVTERPEVLVIGGGGYIGSALVPMLLAQGSTVRLFDRFLFGREAIAPFADHPGLIIHDADYRRTDQLVIAMRHADTVIHLGGIVGDPACALDENLTIELNVAANQAVAEIARAQQVRRFVFASSCSVYGANNEILNEHSQLNPVSLYAQSKVASEVVLEQLADAHFKPTILRLGTVYGLSGRTRFDLVVNLLTAKAEVEGRIPIVGPDQWRPFVHVSDAAAAFALAATTPSQIVANRVFNVGGNEQNMTLGTLGEVIASRVPGAQIVEENSPEDPRNYRVNFDRIEKELGFHTTWTVEQGIDEILEALRSGRIDDYTRSDYSNVAWFKELLGRNALASDGRTLLQSLHSQIGFAEDTGAVRDAGTA